MKSKKCHFSRTAPLIAASYLAAIVAGCRPTVREVTEFMYQVPLGSAREILISDLIAKFGDQLPKDMRNDGIINEPQPLTLDMVTADQDLILLCQREHRFARIYPSDVFGKMPKGALVNTVGFVEETSNGNGVLNIFLDSKTNYIGFMSSTSGNDR